MSPHRRPGLLRLSFTGLAALFIGCSAPRTSPSMIVSISTQAPGLTAEQVESEVTNPIERVTMDLSGPSSVRSMSGQARSYVEVSFPAGNAEAVLAQVRAALAKSPPRLPAAAAQPVLRIEPRSLWSPE